MVQNRARFKGQSRIIKSVVYSDIVFSIDISTSMQCVINGLKRSISDLVVQINKLSDSNIKIRTGFIANKWRNKKSVEFFKKDIIDDVESFKNALDKFKAFGDEISLPAIDWALDFDWRENAHKFVIHFTNETVKNGWNPQKSLDKLDELAMKVTDLGVSLIIIGKNCKEFAQLTSMDKCFFIPIKKNQEFEDINKFKHILDAKISKIVSKGSRGRVSKQIPVKKDIYNLNYLSDFKLINL